jgi:hypothetical protein
LTQPLSAKRGIPAIVTVGKVCDSIPEPTAWTNPYLVSAISAASGVAAQHIVSAVVKSIKKILAKPRESDGEDWRDSRGYL